MTPEEIGAFEAKVRAYIGREIGPVKPGRDPVNLAMIRHWTEVTGDENPVYSDPEFAAKSSKGGVIAPPTMLQIFGAMEGYPMCQKQAGETLDVQRQLHKVFDEHGYVGVLGTNTSIDFYRDIRPGDVISAHTVIDNISERKKTARGVGYFIETVTRFTDQDGKDVGRQVFRVLKFIPNAETAAAKEGGTAEKPALPTRIQAPRGHDNAWWWEAIDQGKLLIQRCKGCGTLRHPPRPMCGSCQSTEWDSIEASLEGEVFSFTEMHYPKFPGYPYPLLCAVIELREGTRLVANLAGCQPEQVHIGMKVKGKVERVDEKTVLPNFYPA